MRDFRIAKRDKNEGQIVTALKWRGALVWRIDQRGLPDLLVGWRQKWFLLEVKLPEGPRGGTAKSELNDAQKEFFTLAEAGELPVKVVRTIEDACQAIGMGWDESEAREVSNVTEVI